MKKDELILKCFSIILIGGSIVSAFICGKQCGYREGSHDTVRKFQPLLDESIENFNELYSMCNKKAEEDPFEGRTQEYLS